jgi:hypothetical protein
VSRWTDPLNQAAAALDAISGVWLIDLEFDSGHVRANDSRADLIFGGNTYYGTGDFGGFDGVEENADAIATGVRFTLTGVSTSLIATIVGDVYQNRPVTLYCGMLTPNSRAFVATPEVAWSGYMDTMPIETRKTDDGIGVLITLTCEHRLRNSPPNSRWSDADQKARSPGDSFFNLTPLVATYVGKWGSTGSTYGPGPGGGVIFR